MHGDPARDTALTVRFRGFDASTRAFLLEIAPSAHHPTAAAKRREIGDFQALDRALAHGTNHSRAFPRLSLRRLKKLALFSWTRDDPASGWRLELQKNVAACDQWLQTALRAASADVRVRFVDDDAYASGRRARAETAHRTQRARQLQQYFTGLSLVGHVVTRLPEVLANAALPALDSADATWLEPSCGDGRLISALAAAGARRVVGYELDDAVHAAAEQNLRHVGGVSVERGDFLTSKPAQDEASTTRLALGNPPFGDDSCEYGKRDLVAKFVVHAAHVWSAQLVAFIVPSRCAKPTYVERLVALLNDRPKEEHRSVWKWSLVWSEPLEDCTFEFQETKRVQQPSAFVAFALLKQ